MGKDGFVFHIKWSDVISQQPPNIRLEVYEAVIEFAKTRHIPQLSPMANLAFQFIKPDIEKDLHNYDVICARNKQNGSKGGRPATDKNPKKPKKPTGLLKNPKKPLGFLDAHNNSGQSPQSIKGKVQLEYLEGIDILPCIRETFLGWLQYRKELKKPFKTKRGVEGSYKELMKLSGGNPQLAKEIVEQSIANEWQGLFELKTQQNNGATNRQNSNRDAEAAQRLAGYATVADDLLRNETNGSKQSVWDMEEFQPDPI